ncbi:MAG TPA: aldehyde dehydrogenase [Bacillota bacterium]
MEQLIDRQHTYFMQGHTLERRFRQKQLTRLKGMLQSFEKEIYQALKTDLNKSAHETLTTELGILYTEIDFAKRHLRQWMEPEQADAPLTHKGTKNYIYKQPYGVVLIIAPWNYPLQLAILPAIGAIAAGNTVVIKPSEHAQATSSLIAHMFEHSFKKEYIAVVEGAQKTSEQLLQQRFDYIFFTGSPSVGKTVMEKASKHVTPVTLELGGKSPAIVDVDANIKLTAKRIVWGKFTNAGQTCVAPDYVYVHKKIKIKLLRAMKKQIKSFYGKRPLQNKDYVRIINADHFNRLNKLLSNGTLYYGGQTDRNRRMIEPTIVENVTWDDPIMKDEIFGPILPVLTFRNVKDVQKTIQMRDKPLALYYFGKRKQTYEHLFKHLSFGGGCINDTLYHLANPHLPFGGVGTSGMGAYHGKYSFLTFSHEKSILKQTTAFDNPLRYPGSKLAHFIVKKILR